MSLAPLFPLSHGVFPDGLLQLNIFEVRYLDLVRRCHRDGESFGVPWLAEGHEVQVPGHVPQLHPVGCMVEVADVVEVEPALLRVVCRGLRRFRLIGHKPGPFGVWHGEFEWLPEDAPADIPPHLQALADQLGRLIRAAQQADRLAELPVLPPYRLDECGWVANRWAELLPLPPGLKADLLAVDDPEERLRRLSGYLEPLA
ncbi:MAG: LON peptidase substrate-binding domain-containing protein [Burkholderiales bacterium]|jgi:Lon protease-like protein